MAGDNVETYWPTLRLELAGFHTRNQVACWPSTGGLWIHGNVHPVLLDYPGLPRFTNVTNFTDPAEEDAFCTQLRKVGATFWESQEEYHFTHLNADDGWWPPAVEEKIPPPKPMVC